jgi:hypothetical protein
MNFQRNISLILGFQKSNLPCKYLGTLLIDKAIKNTILEELLGKLETKIKNWMQHFLTLPWRILLIKFFLSSMPLYLFSVMPKPKGIQF